ncbi:hypothetical protein M758_4G060200 [Ceratodon purpureus]|nr:hypothetical protein M758_4G060200 [Ceratodon purpureus]
MAALASVASIAALAPSNITRSSTACNVASQQPGFSFIALKCNVNLKSDSPFAGVPITSSSFSVAKESRNNGLMRCMATSKSVQVGADIIDKVKQDHKELEEAYSNYKKFHKQNNEDEAAKWFNQFVWEVSRHAVSEELVLYPLIGQQGDKGQKLADESRTEHQKTKDMLAEIQGISDPDVFEKKFDAIMEALREHIRKEENEDLVYLKQSVDEAGRNAAGTTFALGKNIVPTKPHAAVPNRSAALEGALGLHW